MPDRRILEMLQDSSTNTTETSVFARLRIHNVRHIARNITEIMYDSLSSKNVPDGNKRSNLLLLLQRWCLSSGNGCNVDYNKYDCFVKALNKIVTSSEINDQVTFNDDNISDKLSFDNSLSEYYEKLMVVTEKKFKSLEIIKQRDYSKSGNNHMFDRIVSQNPKFVNSFDKLTEFHSWLDLKKLENAICVKNENNNTKLEPLMQNELQMQQKYISLTYALLNLNKSPEDILLLRNILRNLNGNLEPYQVNFIEHIWQKCVDEDVPTEISIQLLENFQFVYEKPFLKVCTNLLQAENISNDLPRSKEIEKILELSWKSKILHYNLTSLIYQMYACSGFNSKLCCLLNIDNL